MTCIREGVTIETAGRLVEANAERHLKPAPEMVRLFRDHPAAIRAGIDLLDRVDFSLAELRYEYPDEPVPPGRSPQEWLEELTWRRAALRYPHGIPPKVEATIKDELALIARLDYAPYFLTIHDIVRVAEDRGILCQGRGSAANSAVCYALGITSVDPAVHQLLFARFISEQRREPPDIDVDFEHERREEIIQYLYERYGRHRAGIAATVIRYRPRSAVREVGKALGLTEDVTARIAGTVWGSWSDGALTDARIREAGLDPENPLIHRAIDLARRLMGFPRHLSQHVGGFVLTRGRLDETVPIGRAAMEGRTFIEWDKDDIDRLGIMKVDILALGMLTAIARAFALLKVHHGRDLDLAAVPGEDQAVYKMLQAGDSVGVFQVESRAQINMLPRLKPATFYDLVIQVAIVRPGPIQGDMVHPYLRRRAGKEAVEFPSPAPPHPPDELRNILGRTLGVPLFQEQAMNIAMTAATFSDAEANQLRKAMATFRNNGTIGRFEEMMVTRMVARGYTPDFARRCFNQIKGFGEYGFPESHAASFARLVYVSAYIKFYYPEVFACALLNAQPMGFYAPAQLVRDAREHDVEVRPADINASAMDSTLEHPPIRLNQPDRQAAAQDSDSGAISCRPDDPVRSESALEDVPASRPALRLGLREIDGFRRDWAEMLVARRGRGYRTIEDLWARAGLPRRALTLLADADALRSVGLDRRAAAWAVRRLPDAPPLPLFAAAGADELAREPAARLPPMPLAEEVVADYQTTHLSLKAHPLAFLRPRYERHGITACADLARTPDGARVKVAGIVLVRQRPGKGNAIFMTIEDETGIANALLWARIFERERRAVMSARLALLVGRIQRSEEGVVHVMVDQVIDRSVDLDSLSATHQAKPEFTRADEVLHPKPVRPPRHGHPRDARILPKSRDFH